MGEVCAKLLLGGQFLADGGAERQARLGLLPSSDRDINSDSSVIFDHGHHQ
jgi:hypothetical protein